MRKTIKWITNPIRREQITVTQTSDGKIFHQTIGQKEDWCKKARKNLMRTTTEEENIVYNKLPSKMKPASFQQYPFLIKGHIYFADIYIKKWKIVIEVDGGYHKSQKQKKKDTERDSILAQMGVRVYRISNDDVRNAVALKDFIHMLKLLKKSYKEDVTKENKYLSNAPEFQKYREKRISRKNIESSEKNDGNAIDNDN